MQFGGWEAARVGALLAMSFMTQNAQATSSSTAIAGYDRVSALNDAGMVVGNEVALGAMSDPFIRGAGVTDISYSSPVLGRGFDRSGQREALLLTPTVPEPSSSELMLAGLAVLGALAWRQRGD